MSRCYKPVRFAKVAIGCSLLVLLSACGGSGGGDGPAPAPTPDQQTPPPDQQTPATAPNIISQPSNMLVNAGQSVTLTVVAEGTAPLSFQWQRDGQPVAGANGASYTFVAASTNDTAIFSVAVTNAAGAVTSIEVLVDVRDNPVVEPVVPLPVIQIQPQAQTVVVGAQATFSVAADGSSLTLQWRKNGVDIAGATDSTYVTPATSLSDSGAIFDVLISNPAGSLSSNAVLLTVNSLPLAPAPEGVDADVQSYLVSMSTGPYPNPHSVGPQTLATQGEASIEAIPGSQAGGVPSQYSTTWALQNFDHPHFYSPLSELTQSLLLTNHSQALIEGLNLDRYDGGLVFNSAVLWETLLIGIRSDLNDVGIGQWKYRGPGQSGYFYGYQLIHGAYVVGEPAADSAVVAITDGTYSGFSYSGVERELSALQGFEELTAQASASYDATTHQVTISIHDFNGYSNAILANFASPGHAWMLNPVWSNPYVESSPVFAAGLSCTATVDPSVNFFTCNLVNSSAAAAGVFKGKFYGPHGDSIGGTFAIKGLLMGSFGDGVVGGIAVTR